MARAIWLRRGSLASALLVVACWQPTTVIRRPIASGSHGIGCGAAANCGDAESVVSITYLGISGLLVEHGGHVLLTDPFISNPAATRGPGVFKWLLKGPRIDADSAAIERLLPRSADRASVILIGHGHYDHLMDVPYIATHRAKSALIVGGPSVAHMLVGDPTLRTSRQRLITIPPALAGDTSRVGQWFYSPDSAFRFMALIAGHAPIVKIGKWGFRFADSRVSADRDSLPHFATDWKLGEPYAYLIDVLSGSSHATIFRIYFEDAPSEPPLGFPSPTLLADRSVDLAVLCAATSSYVDAAPDSLLRVLKPVEVMVTHWESFFRSQLRGPALSHVTDLRQLVRAMRHSLPAGSRWAMPLPHQTIRFQTTITS